MSATLPQPPSDSSWPPSNRSARAVLGVNKKGDPFQSGPLSSIDDSPDFHDPFSELSLFLAKKIKQEIFSSGSAKKWSHKIQEELLEKITPEFQKKFPQLRLRVAPLKKTWEKISSLSHKIQSQKEAISHEGKLNVIFFIKENLKQYVQVKNPYTLQPYHWTHQLAMKLGECIALLDGTRPKMDELAKMIWAIQRHLISGSSRSKITSPYDEYDKIDKLIVKTILELTAKEPLMSQKELEFAVKESLSALHELPSFVSLEATGANVAALLSDKLYSSSLFQTTFLSHEKQAVIRFIKRQITLCKAASPSVDHAELVRRIIALYTLASRLPKNLTNEEIEKATFASYPTQKECRPDLPQSVYAFIAAESQLMRNEEFCHCTPSAIQAIQDAYQEASLLPDLKGREKELLEIVIWKILSENEGVLEKLPYRIGKKIDEELANTLIDNPELSFHEIVHLTVQFFQRTKELTRIQKWGEIERKIQLWTEQGEMLLRWIHLSEDTPLLKLILEMGKSEKNPEALARAAMQAYLQKHPQLALYTPELSLRVTILCKYAFYTAFQDQNASSYDCFLKWHANYLRSRSSSIEIEELLSCLKQTSIKLLPLLPFDEAHARSLIA